MDHQALGEVGHLAEALGQRVGVVIERVENRTIGEEGDRGAEAVSGPEIGDWRSGHAGCVFLDVQVAVADGLGAEPLRKGVDRRDANAVQAARDLIAVSAELPSRMQSGHDSLQARETRLRVHVDWNTPPVVRDGY